MTDVETLENWLRSLDNKLDELDRKMIRLEEQSIKRNGPIVDELHEINRRLTRVELFRSNMYAIMALFTFFVPLLIVVHDHL